MKTFKINLSNNNKKLINLLEFDNENDAINFKKKIENTSNYNFIEVKLKNTNTTMKLYKYLNGYLLIPDKENPYYEMERLNRGVWLNDMKGWFYKKKEYENLLNRNYKLKKIKLKPDYSKYNLSSMEIYFYKTGFLLVPNKDYIYFNQEYLLGGKWIDKQKGWYFKTAKKYNKFVEYGCQDILNDSFFE